MRSIVAGLAALALIAGVPALAQDTTASPAGVFYTGQEEGQWLARDLLLSAKVQNSDGQIIGDIEDLIFNSNNEIEGVVMGTGGFVGLGEKRVGVKLSALKVGEKDGKRTLTLPEATKETLLALAPYERAAPPKSILDRAMERAQELTDKTVESSKETYEAAKKEAGPAYEKAKEAVTETLEKAQEAVTPEPTTPEAPKQP